MLNNIIDFEQNKGMWRVVQQLGGKVQLFKGCKAPTFGDPCT